MTRAPLSTKLARKLFEIGDDFVSAAPQQSCRERSQWRVFELDAPLRVKIAGTARDPTCEDVIDHQRTGKIDIPARNGQCPSDARRNRGQALSSAVGMTPVCSSVGHVARDEVRRRCCHLDGLVLLPPRVGVTIEEAQAGRLVVQAGVTPIEVTCSLSNDHISGGIAAQKTDRRGWIWPSAAWVKYGQERSPSGTIGSVDCDQLLERCKRQENPALPGCSIGGEEEPP